MKLEYTLLFAFVSFLATLVKVYAPDFPLTFEALLALALYVAAKLGVEVVGQPVRNFLASRFPRYFAPRRVEVVELTAVVEKPSKKATKKSK